RGGRGMSACTRALRVSLIVRWGAAAMVSNTRELFPEPDTPVHTVILRLGVSRATPVRLSSRAPTTRIRSWLSARWVLRVADSVVVAIEGFSSARWSGPGGSSSCRTQCVQVVGSGQPGAGAHQGAALLLVDFAPGLDAL